MLDGEWQASLNGLYNLSTGTRKTFTILPTFTDVDLEPNIIFIDMPEDIRDKYQYLQQANIWKRRHTRL